MKLVESPTELTTAATDLLLMLECVVILVLLWQTPVADRLRLSLWSWFFGLLAFSSLLGTIVHGWDMPAAFRNAFFSPIFFGLGLAVVLLGVGAFGDWKGGEGLIALLWFGMGAMVLLFFLSRFFKGALIILAVYMALVIIFALVIYSYLGFREQLRGSLYIALALLLSLAALGIQTTRISLKIYFPFDHNGIFHLLQLVALALLGYGVRLGMKPL